MQNCSKKRLEIVSASKNSPVETSVFKNPFKKFAKNHIENANEFWYSIS